MYNMISYTGERPTVDAGIESSRMRYRALMPYIRDRKVLDFGCGVGFGSMFISNYAADVIGYEPNTEAREDAKKLFPHITFTSNIGDLSSEYAIVMSEVLEHIEKPDVHVLLEGMKNHDFVVSTPNGDLFQYHPMTVNERRGFHVWHYTEQELWELFRKYFNYVSVTAAVRDPLLPAEQWTGLIVYASNSMVWKDSWITDSKCL
jgi:2-polyprenyl-3-methyl-5-hydroxy-6-metoxy-1,4-benzoquinol methylase